MSAISSPLLCSTGRRANDVAIGCRFLRVNGFNLGRNRVKTFDARLLERMGRDDITVHGFRSTFRDWAVEQTNFPREVAEMALAHVVGDKVEAAYRRGDLFEKRRRLMEAWANYCAKPAASGKVVTIGSGKVR